MIRFVKIACLIGIYSIFTRAEAEYLDPSFETNTSGYLYNVGARKYIGLDPFKGIEMVLVDDPKKALRLRTYLKENVADTTIVFLEDKNIPIPERPGMTMGEKDLYRQKGIKVCSLSSNSQVILDKYNGSYKFGLFATPPVLLNENAFFLKKGNLCLYANKRAGNLGITVCDNFETENRNAQMFSWVDASTYNRGIDPVTYRPEDPTYNPEEYIEGIASPAEKKRIRAHSLKHAHLTHPTNLAYSNPYRIE